ncbi:CxxxxCH/CxxCH domain c-type cytochrome [Geoalkalibacter sp.]|uniref:CxxxxCH/CxxCH domain c-type cytochrome n=1 Tax=Geoalkalibacter sp. TaxID=3041440 RepID=UPI00272E27D7|nr:CxxxxCH/CxxCH domain-containing protein [Geoalkalibacter sp.]
MALVVSAAPSWAALPDVPPGGAYIEAEDYVSMGAPSPWAWEVQSSVTGFQGSGYLYTTSGGTGTVPNGSRVDFPVNFLEAGTYQIWLRARDQAGAGGGDSTFWGMDGTPLGALTQNGDNRWEWTTRLQSGTNRVTINSPGAHTLNLWPRETGQHTDAIFIIRTDRSLPGNISEGSTAGVPTGHTALDFSATGPGAGYVLIPDGQKVNGSTIDLVLSKSDGNDLVYDTDLTGLTYRPLLKQSDGFNGFAIGPKWTKTDVGGDTTPAPYIDNSGVLHLTGSGQNIWNRSDYFTYLYQSGISGDFSIDVHVRHLQNTGTYAKAGIMVRQSLALNSQHAMALMTYGAGARFYRRTTPGGVSANTSTSNSETTPEWVRITRQGNTFRAYFSNDGSSWAEMGSDTVVMSDPVIIGLAVTSADANQDNKAQFDNFMFTDTVMGAASGWTDIATPFNAVGAGWGVDPNTAEERSMAIRSGGNLAVNSFSYTSCVDATPSSISIPAGQTVSGGSVSLPSLFDTTGNVGGFTYQINGTAVNNPWNSNAFGTGSTQDVTLTVRGSDPDCGGSIHSASQTITVDNTCQDSTPSTLTIATGQSTGGRAVDLNTLFTKTGDVGSFTYRINGVAVANPWDSTILVPVNTDGTLTLTVSGIDPNNDCPDKPDIVIEASNLIYVDNRCTGVNPTVLFDDNPKYVAAGKQVGYTVTVVNNDGLICDPMDVTLSLVGDSNLTDFNPSSLTGGTQSIPGRGSKTWNLIVGAKNEVPEWRENFTTVRATIANDPNGHDHAAVDATTKSVVFLVSPITHNSITTRSSKWGGKWGTSEAGSKYGNFDCLTCHEKNAPNVKWMRETITTPDGSNWESSGTDTVTVIFNDARDGSEDWGRDEPGRTSSTRSCEVCHSATLYHRYDTTGQAELAHFNDRDCLDCHRHDEGFTADCSNCHGNPPINDTLGGPWGLANLPGATGSTTAGTHYKHVLVLKYPCTYCHANYRAPGEMPKLLNGQYDINHTFNVFGSLEPAATAGHYAGQDGVSYEGFIVPPGQGTLSCENIYCHGGTDNMGGGNPQWNGNISCDSCHGTSATNTPPGYSHSTHVGKMGIACTVCHGMGVGNTTQDNPGLVGFDGDTVRGHVNGSVHIDLSLLTQAPYNNSNPTYRGQTVWDSGTLAPSATYGTCSNIACHYNTETPVWNNGPATCVTCHNNTGDNGDTAQAGWQAGTLGINNAAPNTGNHDEHCDPADGIATAMIGAFVNKCESCHGAGANTGDHDGHIDFTTDFAGGFVYNSVDGSCANTCHKTDATYNWGSSAMLPCHYCHMPREDGSGGGYIGPTVVNPAGGGFDGRDGDGNGTFWTGFGSHLKQTKGDTLGGGTDWNAQCQICHPYHEGGIRVPLPPDNWTPPAGVSSPLAGTNVQEKLGLQYPVTGGIHLKAFGGAASEAEVCWNCHGTDDTINEWGFNTDTAPGFPNSQNTWSGPSHNYGHLYSDAGWTTLTPYWVDTSGKGMYRKDYYQHSTQTTPSYVLSQRISSVHSVNFELGQTEGSSVALNINADGTVKRDNTQTLETRDKIRCTYCHDVHDLNRALVNDLTQESASGPPYLRGSWMGNPYGPDMPPISGYSYPTSGGYHSRGNRFASLSSDNNNRGNMAFSEAVPRLFVDTQQNQGGYFIDQNSGWPTAGRTLEDTAGICILCHGDNVDNLDYYTGVSMWRTSTVNGHSNAVLGGTGANKRNIFDARRGKTSSMWMAAQEGVNIREYGKNPPSGSIRPREVGPFRANFYQGSGGNKAAKDRAAGSPPRNTGWYGGTVGDTSRGSQYGTWYSESGIGTHGGSSGRAHDFTCSKCHSPHASGLPALLITNCLDANVSNWSAAGGLAGPNRTGQAPDVANTCHRKASTTTGWHRLAPAQ